MPTERAGSARRRSREIIHGIIRGAKSRLAVQQTPSREGATELLSLVEAGSGVNPPPFKPRVPCLPMIVAVGQKRAAPGPL
jgi:hypothetical protein